MRTKNRTATYLERQIAIKAAKKSNLGPPGTQQSTAAKRALHALAEAKRNPSIKRIQAALPGVRTTASVHSGDWRRPVPSDPSLSFKWPGGPLLLLQLWLFGKAFLASGVAAHTAAGAAAVFSSMAAACSLVAGPDTSCSDRSLLPHPSDGESLQLEIATARAQWPGRLRFYERLSVRGPLHTCITCSRCLESFCKHQEPRAFADAEYRTAHRRTNSFSCRTCAHPVCPAVARAYPCFLPDALTRQ